MLVWNGMQSMGGRKTPSGQKVDGKGEFQKLRSSRYDLWPQSFQTTSSLVWMLLCSVFWSRPKLSCPYLCKHSANYRMRIYQCFSGPNCKDDGKMLNRFQKTIQGDAMSWQGLGNPANLLSSFSGFEIAHFGSVLMTRSISECNSLWLAEERYESWTMCRRSLQEQKRRFCMLGWL